MLRLAHDFEILCNHRQTLFSVTMCSEALMDPGVVSLTLIIIRNSSLPYIHTYKILIYQGLR